VLADPFYYLSNFLRVLVAIELKYAPLLSTEERGFIAAFRAQPRPSAAMLVRMIVRKGWTFRRSRLNYPEIGGTESAVQPLIAEGWVDAAPLLDLRDLQALLTKEELLAHVGRSRLARRFNKPDLVEFLRAQRPESQPFSDWWPESDDRVYRLRIEALCERLRLLYFGDFHQDFSEFVLADLKVFAYERVPASLHSVPFRTRAHIDAFERLFRCARALADGGTIEAVTADLPAALEDNDWLEDRRQALLFEIAAVSERRGDAAAALELLEHCTHRGARLRRIRLYERMAEWLAARDLCLAVHECPESAAEEQQVARVLPRLRRKLGAAACAAPEPRMPGPCAVPSFAIEIDAPAASRGIELCVRDRLARESGGLSTVHYVENGLVSSLFGLLCWRAIFAPISGAFFHEFHPAPVDLASARFIERRRAEFAACLAELESERYLDTVRATFVAKRGLQSPFVAWGLLTPRLLEEALTCLPPAHLRLWFEWMLRDVSGNRAGFPDLVQFWAQERRYRLVEVKGPGDRLQDNQRRLLELCISHGLPVAVCQANWRATHEDTRS
jgi:hypothetical protein